MIGFKPCTFVARTLKIDLNFATHTSVSKPWWCIFTNKSIFLFLSLNVGFTLNFLTKALHFIKTLKKTS